MGKRKKKLARPLSPGERAIWAAAFVASMERSKALYESVGRNMPCGEDDVPEPVTGWAEEAQQAVWIARNAYSRVVEGFGPPGEADYSAVTQHLKEMLDG